MISVILTTYNAEKFVVEALESLKGQTSTNFDIIITDDCSEDDTVAVCKQWLLDNPSFNDRLTFLESPINTGVSANANRGIKASKNEWLHLLSGDDALMPTAIEDVENFVNENTGCSVLQGIISIYIDEFEEKKCKGILSYGSMMNPTDDFTAREQYKLLLKRFNGASPAAFYKRSALESVGLMDESIRDIDDYPLWLNLTNKGYKIYFLSKILVKYRRHIGSLSDYDEKNDDVIGNEFLLTRPIFKKYINPNRPFLYRWKNNMIYFLKKHIYTKFNNKQTLIGRACLRLKKMGL